jgi:hypothetical protein
MSYMEDTEELYLHVRRIQEYVAYVEREIKGALLRAWYDNEDAGVVQVKPAPWQDYMHAVIYDLGEQQRIYL